MSLTFPQLVTIAVALLGMLGTAWAFLREVVKLGKAAGRIEDAQKRLEENQTEIKNVATALSQMPEIVRRLALVENAVQRNLSDHSRLRAEVAEFRGEARARFKSDPDLTGR